MTYSGIATPAYATSESFPVGRDLSLYLSGAKDLVTVTADVTNGSQSWIKDPLTAMSGGCRCSGRRWRRPRLRGSRQVVTWAPGLWRCFAGRVAGVLAFGLVLAACSGSAPGGDASAGPSATTSASATATVTASAAIDALLRERGFTGAALVRRGRDVLVRRGYADALGFRFAVCVTS